MQHAFLQERKQTTHKPKASTCRKMLFPYVLALFPFPLFGNRTGIFVPREKESTPFLHTGEEINTNLASSLALTS